MLAGKINNKDFSIEWTKGEIKGTVKAADTFVNYLLKSSRRVLVFDPYMNQRRHADMLHSEFDAWLILNRMSSEQDIKLEFTKTDIKYEPETLWDEMEQTKF